MKKWNIYSLRILQKVKFGEEFERCKNISQTKNFHRRSVKLRK